MKKNLVITAVVAIAVIIIISIFNNGDEAPVAATGTQTEEKIVALSTFTIIADMVANVGGDKIESISLTKPGAEIHGYQPTPSDLVKASEADLIFENGMNLELWTEKLRAGIPDVPTYTVSKDVEVIDISSDIYAGKPNPHAWMSPQQGLIYVENIRVGLTEVAPEHAEYFAEQAAAYSAEIMEVDADLLATLESLPENNRVLVTCEGAFSYLTNDYNLEEVYLWAINAESMGSPQQVARVIATVTERNIPAVFCESTVEPHIQREVVDATGARLGGILYVDSLSGEEGPASTYLKMLQHTASTINAGLTGN